MMTPMSDEVTANKWHSLIYLLYVQTDNNSSELCCNANPVFVIQLGLLGLHLNTAGAL